MRHYRGPYLPARPAFLLTARLPYDDLLRGPERFAGSPGEACMDVLSEVLKVVKLQGAMFYNGEFSSPWSFCSPPSRTVAPFLKVTIPVNETRWSRSITAFACSSEPPKQ